MVSAALLRWGWRRQQHPYCGDHILHLCREKVPSAAAAVASAVMCWVPLCVPRGLFGGLRREMGV